MKTRNEYVIIDDYIVNQNCEQVQKLGHFIATLTMPSRCDVDDVIAKKFPGAKLIGETGRNLFPELINLPGIGKLVIEFDESPIGGDYENGWETSIYIHQ